MSTAATTDDSRRCWPMTAGARPVVARGGRSRGGGAGRSGQGQPGRWRSGRRRSCGSRSHRRSSCRSRSRRGPVAPRTGRASRARASRARASRARARDGRARSGRAGNRGARGHRAGNPRACPGRACPGRARGGRASRVVDQGVSVGAGAEPDANSLIDVEAACRPQGQQARGAPDHVEGPGGRYAPPAGGGTPRPVAPAGADEGSDTAPGLGWIHLACASDEPAARRRRHPFSRRVPSRSHRSPGHRAGGRGPHRLGPGRRLADAVASPAPPAARVSRPRGGRFT